ncbi:MAG: nicotinamide-nucleotide adenylyltransferase [Promethearchaeota archaeon]
MKEEIIACIDKKHVKFLETGQISKYIFPMGRKEAHEKKIAHIITRLFIMTITPKNDILYLVQKRSKNKRSYPDYFTDSASGHVIYEKNLDILKIEKNALRELEEEFGIPIKSVKNLIFRDLQVEKDNFTGEIAYIFYGLVNNDINLEPDPHELNDRESHFYNRQQLIELLDESDIVDYSRDIWREIINIDIFSLFKINNNYDQEIKKKEEIALFIGRFQPLHHGHIYVIKNILKDYKKIKIGIGSSQLSNSINDPFTSTERIRFIKASMKKRGINKTRYEIFEIPDIYNAKKWVNHVVSIVGEFDIVFSNSNWVRNLFENEGYEVGKKLEIFKKKYNGTNVRKLIKRKDQMWRRLIPKEVVELILEYNGLERISNLGT